MSTVLRRPKFWIITILGLLVLLAVADRGGQYALERVVAGRIQDSMATPSRPSVDLGGFPFLPEIVRGKLQSVEVEIRDGDAGRVTVEQVQATLTGVRQRGDGIQVESISGDGIVTYDDISAAARPLRVGFGGEGLVEVTAGITVLGEDLSASAAGRPRIEGNRLIVKPERATTSTGGDASQFVSRIPEIRILLRDVPPNLDIDLDPTEAGIEFTFGGEDVFLRSTDTTAAPPSAPVLPSETSVSPGGTAFTRSRPAT